jgi:hypothetical protein
MAKYRIIQKKHYDNWDCKTIALFRAQRQRWLGTWKNISNWGTMPVAEEAIKLHMAFGDSSVVKQYDIDDAEWNAFKNSKELPAS